MRSIQTFHPRRGDRDMPRESDQLALLRRGQWLTLAMCDGGEPYLVTLNYAFCEQERCFYVHCATEGRKLQILRKNARVWGQVVEDHGYVQGKCTHHYCSVMFQGQARFVEEPQAKLRALEMLVEKFEPDPAPVKKRFLENLKAETLVVLQLRIEAMSGKQNPGAAKAPATAT